jgi:hypothetical protein
MGSLKVQRNNPTCKMQIWLLGASMSANQNQKCDLKKYYVKIMIFTELGLLSA